MRRGSITFDLVFTWGFTSYLHVGLHMERGSLS